MKLTLCGKASLIHLILQLGCYITQFFQLLMDKHWIFAGIDFEAIATIDGAGNSSSSLTYQWVDESPLNTVGYYRLKQTDFNGDFSYSGLLASSCQSTNDFIIYPNPLENEITLQFDEITDDRSYKVEILDNLGRMVYAKDVSPNTGQMIIRFDNNLPKGSYFIRVINENTVTSKKLLKL